MFSSLDVVQYSTGKTYMVCTGTTGTTETTVWAMGWKNGKPFGAIRALKSEGCTLVGKALRPQERGDAWGYTEAAK